MKTTLILAAIALVLAGAAHAEGEGNGDPFPFRTQGLVTPLPRAQSAPQPADQPDRETAQASIPRPVQTRR